MFPLGSTLLPAALLPLHVFEDRYRIMIRECLDADREFGVALIERGAETGGGDTRSTVATIAQVVEAEEFDDGRWAVKAVGTRRIRVEEWLEDDPFPVAMVHDWPDELGGKVSRKSVTSCVGQLIETLELIGRLGHDVDLEPDIAVDPALASYQIGVLAPFGPFDRQRVLTAPTVADRFDLLSELLSEQRLLLSAHGEPG